jgi:hypothetical protein
VSTSSFPCKEVLSLNSCVTAMPILAKASEVRNQARNVRSGGQVSLDSQSIASQQTLTQSKMVASHTALVFQF